MTDSYAWLIEAPGQFYLRASKIGSLANFSWTNDHNAALRFYSEEQADLAMMSVRSLQPELFAFGKVLRDPKPVEHGWIGGLPASQNDARPEQPAGDVTGQYGKVHTDGSRSGGQPISATQKSDAGGGNDPSPGGLERERNRPPAPASGTNNDPFYALPSEKALKQACVLADVQFTTADMLIRGGNADPGFVRALYALARKIDEESQVHSASGTDDGLVEELASVILDDPFRGSFDTARAILPILTRERDAALASFVRENDRLRKLVLETQEKANAAFVAGEAKERADVVRWHHHKSSQALARFAATKQRTHTDSAIAIERGEHKENRDD